MPNPLLTSPSRFSFGTSQFCSTISTEPEEVMPSLVSGFPVLYPAKSFSTMKAEIPFEEGAAGSVFA
jgi:hypothetical protein